MASLPHISVVGACATGTHGSGDANRGLAATVSGLDLIDGDGRLRSLSRDADGDRFAGAVVSLGALGVIVGLTLQLVPSFRVSQYVYDRLPRAQFDAHWAEIFASGHSVSVFTDWRSRDPIMVWVKQRLDGGVDAPPPRWFGAVRADGPRHPIPALSPVHCTEQNGVPGPWYDRLPHFRLGFTPSSGEEMQSEWLLPREHTLAAMAALDGLRDRIAPVLQVCELRTIAADDLWLSPTTGRDSVGLHFTWIKDAAAVLPVIEAVEERLAPFEPRPHWGKVFATDPRQLRARYPRADDFIRLCREYDPAGRWRNEWLDTYLPV